MSELRNAILALNRNRTVEAHKAKWEDVPQREWAELVRFFEANHEFLKNWRNDVGGHFEDRAAAFAIDNVEPETVGALELYVRDGLGDARVKFAYELVATAMVKNRGRQPIRSRNSRSKHSGFWKRPCITARTRRGSSWSRSSCQNLGSKLTKPQWARSADAREADAR